MDSNFDDTNRFPIDTNETFLFTRAEFYNFHPVPVKKPWRDATGGFGSFVPLQGWIRLYDDQGFCGEGFPNRLYSPVRDGHSSDRKRRRKV